jgi:hypothetical protein
MPASSYSLIALVIGHLAELVGDAVGDSPRLLTVLAGWLTPPRTGGECGIGLLAILGLGGVRGWPSPTPPRPSSLS